MIIKFRAWDSITKKMFNPDFISRDGLAGMSIGTKEHPNDLVYDSVRFPVMMFTGLKDKNGNEIYEKDILRCDNLIGIVTYSHDRFCQIVNGIPEQIWAKQVKIVGNIYENKGLLTR